MIPEVFHFPYFKYYFIIILIWFLIYTAYRFYKSFSKDTENDFGLMSSIFVFLFSISIVGLSIGLIAGNSRNGITDIVVSSVLTAVGGLISMIFLKEQTTKGDKLIAEEIKIQNIYAAAFIGISISLSIMYGIHVGARFRIENQRLKTEEELLLFEEKLKIEQKYSSDAINSN